MSQIIQKVIMKCDTGNHTCRAYIEITLKIFWTSKCQLTAPNFPRKLIFLLWRFISIHASLKKTYRICIIFYHFVDPICAFFCIISLYKLIFPLLFTVCQRLKKIRRFLMVFSQPQHKQHRNQELLVELQVVTKDNKER